MPDERDRWAMVGPCRLLSDPAYDPTFEGEWSVEVQVGEHQMGIMVDHVTPVPDEAGSWLYMAWLGPEDLDVLHAACFHVASEHQDRAALEVYGRIKDYIKATQAFHRGRSLDVA